jgi:predicted small integral membrane protein
MESFSWMAWTLPVAVFFVGIALLLVGMTVWELRSPTLPRKGLLPLVTTRGDRLFIGLLMAALVNLAWAGLTDVAQGYGAALGTLAVIATMRWG